MEVGQCREASLEGHAVDVEDVVAAEVEPRQAAQVPEDSLGQGGQRVAREDKGVKGGGQGPHVFTLQLTHLVVCTTTVIKITELGTRSFLPGSLSALCSIFTHGSLFVRLLLNRSPKFQWFALEKSAKMIDRS